MANSSTMTEEERQKRLELRAPTVQAAQWIDYKWDP